MKVILHKWDASSRYIEASSVEISDKEYDKSLEICSWDHDKEQLLLEKFSLQDTFRVEIIL